MKVCRNVFVSVVGIAILAVWTVPQLALAGGPEPQKKSKKPKTTFVVIVKAEEFNETDETIECRVFPHQRHVKSGEYLVFVNLSDERITFDLKPKEKNPFADMKSFTLEPDDHKTLMVAEGINELKHPYVVTGNCFTGYPGPWILIP